MKGIAKDGLYKLLSLPHDSSQFKSIMKSSATTPNLLTVNKIPGPEFMLFFSCNETCTSNNELHLWHMRLGHPNINDLVKTLSACNISFGNKTSGLSFCKACQLGKQHRLSFKHSETTTSKALEIIHSDLWGPAPIESNQGFRYYIAFINDKTSYTWVYGLTQKSQALTTFISFKNQIEKSLELKIKALQYDMGGEYKTFEPYLKHEGISLRYSCPYTYH